MQPTVSNDNIVQEVFSPGRGKERFKDGLALESINVHCNWSLQMDVTKRRERSPHPQLISGIIAS